MYLMQIISGLRYKFFETLNFYAHELLSNFISRNASNTLSLSSTLFLTFSPDGIYWKSQILLGLTFKLGDSLNEKWDPLKFVISNK